MLAICAAFAAPLLSFTGRQSFGINLFGRAKAGKTTALLAGASVIGLGREADLPNCGATAAAKGESARMFNDMLLPLNEVGLLGGSKKKAYPEIRDYAIFAEKTRDECGGARDAAGGEEFVVTAAFDDAAVVEDQDHVGVADRA